MNSQNFRGVSEFRCPICNSVSDYIFTSRNEKKIYHCLSLKCAHFFTPVIHHNQGVCIRDDDIESESNQSLAIFGERNQRLLKSFLKLLGGRSGPVTFLDYGAGNAHLSRTIKQVLGDQAKIYCLDANPACANLYQKFGLIQISDLNDLQEKIDFVYMIEVIEHLLEPIEEMKKLTKFIDAKGMIFISTPVGNKNENRTNAYETPSHIHFFSQKSLNLLLKRAGMRGIVFKFRPEMYPIHEGRVGKLRSIFKNAYMHITINILNINKVRRLVGVTKIDNMKNFT